MNPQEQGFVEKYIGRLVAFGLGPTLAVAALPVTKLVNSVFNLDLSNGQVVHVTEVLIGAIALKASVWLWNRGKFEQAEQYVKGLLDGAPEIPTTPAGEAGGDVGDAGKP